MECERCGLVWADAQIDPETIREHFEVAYKNHDYFRRSRNAIFQHLVTVVDSLASRNDRILDIGGARGDLMAKVVARRPDLIPTVNDLSKAATDWAADQFGFATLTGDANQLAAHSEQYGVVVLSDVLYYEPNIAVLWSALPRLIRPGGALVIRVPNRALLIRLGQLWFRLTHTRAGRALRDRVSFYNPEHIFVLRQPYLRSRIMELGFQRVQAIPSPLLSNANSSVAQSTFFRLALIANHLSRHTLVLTPSMLLIGRNRGPNGAAVGDT